GKAEADARRGKRLVMAGIYVLLIGVIVGLVGWIEQSCIVALVAMWPYVLTPAGEQALKPDPNQNFRECAPKQQDKDYCPDMVVVPAGSFMMGSPAMEQGNRKAEEPLHQATIAKPFAVSKYELTFD